MGRMRSRRRQSPSQWLAVSAYLLLSLSLSFSLFLSVELLGLHSQIVLPVPDELFDQPGHIREKKGG
jgi:uncharacterized paraquat-inducible protein A